MAFFKDKLGFYLFLITYLIIFIQCFTFLIAKDTEEPNDTYLFYHKCYFFLMAIMSIWCHIKCATTDPGIITSKNNPAFVEFYLNVHELAVRRALKFNQAYGDVFFKNIEEDGDYKPEEGEEELSDYDEKTYEPITSITDESMQRLTEEYKIEFKRCSQCYVVRPPRGHHCPSCGGCVMKMDHHCPWINNCIGQFTQKFFIQYCMYSLSGCFESVVIVLYYMMYKSKQVSQSWGMIILIFFQMFFAVIFIIFDICMINEQWTIIQNDTTMIDMKKKKFLEKRDFNEVLNETFGKGFDLSWFLPIKVGGFRPFFYKLLKGRRRN